MTIAAKYTLEQWAEARRLRAEGLSFGAIAERLGFTRASSISARASVEGWPKSSARRTAAKPAVRTGRMTPSAARTCRALALRLYGYMELELRALELRMQKRLDDFETSPQTGAPIVTKEERDAFANLIDNINRVTEIASEPALAAAGRRKSAALNPELTALSDELDADALAAASQKDELRREIADELKKLGPPSAST